MLGPRTIRQFTAEVAGILAAQHARDPMGELIVWLHIALRREASVGEIYGVANLERRMERVAAPPEIERLMRMTISGIWAQERGHAAYLEAALSAVARPSTLWRRLDARVDGVLGALEGHVLSGRTSPSQLQRAKAALLLAIGRRVQDVPDFVAELSELSFREFLVLNSELEITAVHGYERMLHLLAKIGEESRFPEDTTLAFDVGRMLHDERWHNGAFLTMESWFSPTSGNATRAGLSVAECSARLGAIRAEVYAEENRPVEAARARLA